MDYRRSILLSLIISMSFLLMGCSTKHVYSSSERAVRVVNHFGPIHLCGVKKEDRAYGFVDLLIENKRIAEGSLSIYFAEENSLHRIVILQNGEKIWSVWFRTDASGGFKNERLVQESPSPFVHPENISAIVYRHTPGSSAIDSVELVMKNAPTLCSFR